MLLLLNCLKGKKSVRVHGVWSCRLIGPADRSPGAPLFAFLFSRDFSEGEARLNLSGG